MTREERGLWETGASGRKWWEGKRDSGHFNAANSGAQVSASAITCGRRSGSSIGRVGPSWTELDRVQISSVSGQFLDSFCAVRLCETMNLLEVFGDRRPRNDTATVFLKNPTARKQTIVGNSSAIRFAAVPRKFPSTSQLALTFQRHHVRPQNSPRRLVAGGPLRAPASKNGASKNGHPQPPPLHPRSSLLAPRSSHL